MATEKVEQNTAGTYPIYRESDEDLPPGLYLALYHGFENEQARQAHTEAGGSWGANGPVIGPLRFVQTATAYGNLVRPAFVDPARACVYGLDEGFPRLEVDSETGCLLFDGLQFGDWTVFIIADSGLAAAQQLNSEKE